MTRPLARLVLVCAMCSICAPRSALAVVLPADWSITQGTNGIFYEGIGDSRLTNVLHPAPAGTSLLGFIGDYAGPIVNLPTYNYQIWPGWFPFVQVDAAHDVLIMHPGTSGFDPGQPTANVGASVRIQVAESGLYSVIGGFARDNVSFEWGNGVDVLVMKGMELDSPLFSAHLASNHVVDVTQPFAGTGTAMFNLQVPLLAGESLRFVAFSDGQGQNGTFDSTAFRVAVAQVPEPTSLVLAAFGLIGLAAVGWRRVLGRRLGLPSIPRSAAIMQLSFATLTLCVLLSGQCPADIVRFNGTAEVATGYLWGTMDVDTTAGTVVDSSFYAGVLRPSPTTAVETTFSGPGVVQNIGGPFGPHWRWDTGVGSLIMAFGPSGLVGYTGGPLTLPPTAGVAGDSLPISSVYLKWNGGSVPYSGGATFRAASGYFTTDPVPPLPPHTIVTYAARGMFADGVPLTGSVTIDITLGRFLTADLFHGSEHISTDDAYLSGPTGGIFSASTNADVYVFQSELWGGNVFTGSGWNITGRWGASNSGPWIDLLPGARLDLLVPEPSSFVLAALGLIGLVVWRRRKR